MSLIKLLLPLLILVSFQANSQTVALTENTEKIKVTKKTKKKEEKEKKEIQKKLIEKQEKDQKENEKREKEIEKQEKEKEKKLIEQKEKDQKEIEKKEKKGKKNQKNIIDTSIPPSKFFNLSSWSLSVPTDDDLNEKADQVYGDQLNTSYSNEYFYASADGGMVFKCPIDGYKTSKNTTYTRSELREMLRKEDKSIKTKGPNLNNWVLKSSPNVNTAGGYDGVLNATLAVNHVTTTGDPKHVGRVIIGQIHASHDEPLRIYYRKLPNSKKGSIYFAHEGRDNGKEDIYELIGSKDDTDVDPYNGIALNEKFSYEVKVVDNILSVSIIRPNKPRVQKVISMSKSGYDVAGEYMYFKAGVYNQNKTGKSSDYVQATFYALSNEHKKNQ